MKKIYVPYVNPMGKMDKMMEILFEMLDADPEIEYTELDAADERRVVYMAPLEGADGIMIGATNILGDLMNPIWEIIAALDEQEKGKTTPEVVVGVFGCYDFFGEGVSFVNGNLKKLRINRIGDGICVPWDMNEKQLAKVRAYFEEFIAAVKARPEA